MAGPGDEIASGAGGRSHLRASHADREQVIDMLKAAFVQGQLTKAELDRRVGQVLASLTYADLAALTADIPAGPAGAQPLEPARESEGDGQLVSHLPLTDAAVPYALAGAGIAALCALFTYHALDSWIRSPWLRALAGAALILLPLAPIEIADSAVGAPWYVLTALFFALLWRPKNWAGMTAAALVAFAAASSEILAVIYAPLVLLRLMRAAVARARSDGGLAGGHAGADARGAGELRPAHPAPPRPGQARPVARVLLPPRRAARLGWRVCVRLVQIAGLNGATVMVCAILVAGLCWALITGSSHSGYSSPSR